MNSLYSLTIHDNSPRESLEQQEKKKRLVLFKTFLCKVLLLQGCYPIAPVVYSIQIMDRANGDTMLAGILGQVPYTFSTATVSLLWSI